MTEAGSKPSEASTGQQILAEHRKIREFGQQIEQSRDLAELLGLLGKFRELLELHFMTEEAPDGFYDDIRSMSPRQLAKVDQLQKEHPAFLAAIDRVREHARACLAGPVAAVLAEAGALAGRLRTHEAAEDNLLLDTIYTDLGQGN
jgi:hypothetical protein